MAARPTTTYPHGLVSYDYTSDNSSKYDPSSSDDETHKFRQPEIDSHDDIPADWDEQEGACRLLTAQEMSHRLSNTVRRQYYTFLEKLLWQNYRMSSANPQRPQRSCHDILKCTDYLEKRALKSCMIVSLYRKAMLKVIAEIRRDSKQHKLYDAFTDVDRLVGRATDAAVQTDDLDNCDLPAKIEHAVIKSTFMLKKKKTTNTAVQTDPLPRRKPVDVATTTVAKRDADAANSLEEKIKKFERKLDEENRKRKQFSHYLTQKQKEEERRSLILTKKIKHAIAQPIVSTPSPCTSSDMFFVPKTPTALMETPTALLETPISDAGAHQTEDSIAKELQTLFGNDDDQNTDIFGQSTNSAQINAIFTEISNFVVPAAASTISNSSCTEPMPPANCHSSTFGHTADVVLAPAVVDFETELRNSLWPCELHRQRMHLHQVLTDIASKGFRYNEKVRRKFERLFGPEDGDDDFGPYSPSMDLDDVILASCKNRIAPWIVKSLMRPMKERLIANRYLFKKLAKTIAEKLILLNQYPDADDVDDAVNEYFCLHPCVNSIEDVY